MRSFYTLSTTYKTLTMIATTTIIDCSKTQLNKVSLYNELIAVLMTQSSADLDPDKFFSLAFSLLTKFFRADVRSLDAVNVLR